MLPPSQISVFDWSAPEGQIRKASPVLCVCGFQAAAFKPSHFSLKSDNTLKAEQRRWAKCPGNKTTKIRQQVFKTKFLFLIN